MKQQQTILVADDDLDLCKAISSRAFELGLDVVTAHDAAMALSLIDQVQPDLICLDVEMPQGNGLAVREMIANDERLAGTPVIILTGKTDDETIQRCHNLCAYHVPKGPDLWARLQPLLQDLLNLETTPTMNMTASEDNPTHQPTNPLSVDEPNDPIMESIFSALGVNESYLDGEPETSGNISSVKVDTAFPIQSDSQQPWILHIDDDDDLSNALKMRLESFGISVVQAFDGMNGVRHAFSDPADVIILDYQMPNGNGEYVLRRLKECKATKDIPVIVLTGRRELELEQQMMNLGVDRFFNKPVQFDRLLDALRQYIPVQEPRGEACLLA